MKKKSEKEPKQRKHRLLRAVIKVVLGPKKHDTTVYFISGMCYNCTVFDKLKLPEGFRKHYLEWYVPRPDETLEEYARKMAEEIDTSRPFILVGYSFGAVIMQEMSRFLKPEKSIIISSFKRAEEVPSLFRAVRRTRLARKMPLKAFSSTDFITGAFNRFVYNASNRAVARYMTQIDPVYIKWAVEQITDWVPDNRCEHLYHIHGTRDQIFPFELLRNVFAVEGGDHLMLVKRPKRVSAILNAILLMRELPSTTSGKESR